ncbi:MAG: phosphoenolpyruvate carboxykinase domain-containing protein, partial [Acidobacteriota bacterium]|nr:phosphoenolpyruvate carboxykinase domain-containing protein [Acidobacteriota bacterium]
RWVIQRVHGEVGARETPIGLLPEMGDLNLDGLSVPRSKIERLFDIKPAEWRQEVGMIKKFFEPFGRHVPYELRLELEKLERSMGA